MREIPFQNYPAGTLFWRYLGIASPLMVVGYFLVGAFAPQSVFLENEKLVNRNDTQVYSERTTTVVRAAIHYKNLAVDLFSAPEGCGFFEEAESEFRRNQCNEFRGRYLLRGMLGALPFFLVALLMWFTRIFTRGSYRQAERLVRFRQPAVMGTVTNPPLVQGDLYCWLLDFKAIAVQLQDKSQCVVYLPFDVSTPLPGEKVTLFKLSEFGGMPRFVAVLYAPHMAVVSGGK